jgi:hypothetical protein
MAGRPVRELESFHRFLTEQLADGRDDLTVEESVAAFRAYQADLERLRKDIQPAVQRHRRGEGRELDYEAIKDEVTARLAERGITD